MKLYNQTKLPDAVLKPILSAAARRIGCKAKDVIVKITAKRRTHGRDGWAERYRWGIKEWFLKKGSKSKRTIQCSGFVAIGIPLGVYDSDPLRIAERVYKVALHEFKHVKDFHDREHFGDYGRNWKNRPHEIRAVDATDEALAKELTPKMQDAIINLGIAVEEEGKRMESARRKRNVKEDQRYVKRFPDWARERVKAWEDQFEGEPGYDLRLKNPGKSEYEFVNQIYTQVGYLLASIERFLERKTLSDNVRADVEDSEINARCILDLCRELMD